MNRSLSGLEEKVRPVDAGSNLRMWEERLKDRYLLQEHIGKVRVPALALWGGRDKVFDISGAQNLKTLLPHVDMQIFPGIGHLPMMEAPKETARLYTDFLRRMPSAGQRAGTAGH